MNNWNSFAALITGLVLASVHRLTKTKKNVGKLDVRKNKKKTNMNGKTNKHE